MKTSIRFYFYNVIKAIILNTNHLFLYSNDSEVRRLSWIYIRSIYPESIWPNVACEMFTMQWMPCTVEREMFYKEWSIVLQRRFLQVSKRSLITITDAIKNSFSLLKPFLCNKMLKSHFVSTFSSNFTGQTGGTARNALHVIWASHPRKLLDVLRRMSITYSASLAHYVLDN